MLDWLIVGGGVHGTYLSRALVGEGGWPADRVRVLDPHARPLAAFFACCEAVGVDYLRSPAVHHLDADPMALFERARHDRAFAAPFRGRVARPAYGLFRRHSLEVVERFGLERLRLPGRARGLERIELGWRVETSEGELTARHVILAIGTGEAPLLPDWAGEAPPGWVRHVFSDPGADPVEDAARVVIVGGGISAVQMALRLARERPGTATLLARHAPRLHEFDADGCWMGPKCGAAFDRERCPVTRRRMIREARHRGSVPRELAFALEAAIKTGAVASHRGEVVGLAPTVRPELPELRLTDGSTLPADRVLLATGFSTQRPGGAWLDAAISDHGLPLAPCGYPIVDRRLAWAPGLHVSGPLAELEIGPVARNLLGARQAAARILAAR